MAGLAALARGVLFTAAVCLALVVSVSVLFGTLRFARAVGGPAWIPGVLAILAFVLVVGGPAYLLAIRGDSDDGGSEQALDDGATPGAASPVDGVASDDRDEHDDSDDHDEHDDSDDHPRSADGSRGSTSDGEAVHSKDQSAGDEPSDGPDGDGESLGTPGG